jgi:hypothetical protein
MNLMAVVLFLLAALVLYLLLTGRLDQTWGAVQGKVKM